MFPILLKIGPISIKSYGFFVAVAFLISLNYVRLMAKKNNLNPSIIQNLSVGLLISGIVGARALHVILNWELYEKNLIEILYLWHGGLEFFGGVATSIIYGIIYILKYKLQFFQVADIISPGLYLGVAIARIGCFFAGCCYGTPTTLPWGVIFTHNYSFAPRGVPLHPTQLYETVFCFLLFLVLHIFSRQKRLHGEIFFSGLIIYSIWRFFIQFLRADDTHQVILGVQATQLFTVIIIFVCSVILIIRQWRKTSQAH